MKITVEHLRLRKRQGPKIAILTSYDFPMAVLEDQAGIDVQLVGDSVGTNVLGLRDETEVTMEHILHHLRAVARGARRSFVLADMPFGSFATEDRALENALRLRDAGADGVKIEGESEAVRQIARVCGQGIPVCAHIGYTPQTDGVKASIQGKTASRVTELLHAAIEAKNAGAFMIVLELLPEKLGQFITEEVLDIPTIGIGSGKFCDGQVLVVHDAIGLGERRFRHARTFGDLRDQTRLALLSYVEAVRTTTFPADRNAAAMPPEAEAAMHTWRSGRDRPLPE